MLKETRDAIVHAYSNNYNTTIMSCAESTKMWGLSLKYLELQVGWWCDDVEIGKDHVE